MAICDSCGGRVNDVVVVCPHCGHKRADVKPTYTKAEIGALLATDEAMRGNGDSFGLVKSLVAPHKYSHGIARVAELVLTGLTLPAVLIGALGIAMFRGRKARTALLSTTGELLPVFIMTLLGGGAIWTLFGADYAAIAITAMWARAAIRIISVGRHERAQAHPETPIAALPSPKSLPPSAKPELPPARVVTPAAPVVAPPLREPVATREPVSSDADEPSDTPRFLR